MPPTLLRRRLRRARLSAVAAIAAAAALPAVADAAVVATYAPAADLLTVFGDDAPNTIVVSRDAGGRLLVNGGAVAVLGGTPTVANTAEIRVFGQAAGDVLRLDERSGALPRASLFGGAADDFMVGGSKADQLFGSAGNDTADGAGGDDVVFLGDGGDKALWSLNGGSDFVSGGAQHDRLRMVGSLANDDFRTSADGSAATVVHNRSASVVKTSGVEESLLAAAGGDDDVTLASLASTDMRKVAVDLAATAGGAAPDEQRDRVAFTGNGNVGDVVTVAGHGAPAASLGTTVTVRAGETGRDTVTVDTGGGGQDTIDASGLPAGSAKLTVRSRDGRDLVSGGHGADAIDAGTQDDDVRAGAGADKVVAEAGNDKVDGGDGNDTIDAREGDDQLAGGAGDDIVFAGLGNDVARLGAGNDRLRMASGQGSDTVEGEGGFDRLEHAGSGGEDHLKVARSGARVQLSRSFGDEVTDVGGIERIAPGSSLGDDSVSVGDVAGTELREVDVDLAGAGQNDSVGVHGTTGADRGFVKGTAAKTLVTGLPVTVRLSNADADDSLHVVGLAGDDTLDASGSAGDAPGLSLTGDGGADTVIGSAGRDLLLGGTGADALEGGRGDDIALLGTHDDRFAWAPGDGSDTVEGMRGTDALDFAGHDAGESIGLMANGDHVRLARDSGAVAMDLSTIETIGVHAGGGADRVKVGDLAGTGVTAVSAHLGTGDGAADRATVDGTAGDDRIVLTGRDGAATVAGLPVATSVAGAGEDDRLEVRGLAGADAFDTSGLGPIAFGLLLEAS